METRNSRGVIADALSGTATQRGVKLGIVAGCLSIFLLFGSNALQKGNGNSINLEQGQVISLVLALLPGFLALVIAAVLAYYAGLSAPHAKSGESRDGLIAGSITMLFFWGGQTLFIAVTGLGNPQGLELSSFIGTRLIAAILFFVVGGVLGWGGSRAAARRGRSILSPPTSSFLGLSDSGANKPELFNPPTRPEISATANGDGVSAEELEYQEMRADVSEQNQER